MIALVVARLGRIRSRTEEAVGLTAAVDPAVLVGLAAGVVVETGPRSAAAVRLFVPEQRQLVLWRQLRRQTQREDAAFLVDASLAREIGRVGPFRGIAGILVGENARLCVGVVYAAVIEEEPQAVAENRTADRGLVVPEQERFRWRRQDAQLCSVEVVGLHRVVERGNEERSRQRVAALLRHDRHLRSTGFRLAEIAGDGEGYLRGVLHVGDVA